MSTRTGTMLYEVQVLSSGALRSAPLRIVRSLARSAHRFITSLQAAQAIVRRADFYYSRTSEELGRMGITREDVPAALLREYERYLYR